MPEVQRRRVLTDPVTHASLRFYLDETISRNRRGPLTLKIEKRGGTIVGRDVDADVVVISKAVSSDQKRVRQARYQASKDRYKNDIMIEYVMHIERCIDEGRWKPSKRKIQGMSGHVGRGRVEFTRKDDANLTHWLAMMVPDKGAGGRRGQNVYKDLVAAGALGGEFEWARRHSWESWRNRYNKNHAEFDQKIEELVPQVNPGRKHGLSQDRRKNKKQYYHAFSSDEENQSDDSDDSRSLSRIAAADRDYSSSDSGPRDRSDRPDDRSADEDDGLPVPPSHRGRHAPRNAPKDIPVQEDLHLGDNDVIELPAARSSQLSWDVEEPNPLEGRDTSKGGNEFLAGRSRQGRHTEGQKSSLKRMRAVDSTHVGKAAISGVLRPPTTQDSEDEGENTDAEREMGPSKRQRRDDNLLRTQPIRKAARRPPNFGIVPESESDEGESDETSSEPEVSHSLFSDDSEPTAVQEDESYDTALSPRKSNLRPIHIQSSSVGTSPRLPLPETVEIPDSEDEENPSEKPSPSRSKRSQARASSVARGRNNPPEPTSPRHAHRAPSPATGRIIRKKRAPRSPMRNPFPRMTRSRSRSVDATFVSLPLYGASRRNGKTKAIPEEEPQEEEILPEPLSEEHAGEEPVPMEEYRPETSAEEQDVLQMVTNENDYSGTSVIPDEPQVMHDQERNRESSIELVDMEVVHNSTTHETSNGPPWSPLLGPTADEILRTFQESAWVRSTPRASHSADESSSRRSSSSSSPQRWLASSPRRMAGPRRSPDIFTPLVSGKPSSHPSNASVASSEESYPPKGTKAKIFNEMKTREEKRTPYRPPRGTRASLLPPTQGLWD